MKHLLTILCISISTFAMVAQDKLYEKSKVGIKGGYNMSSASIDGDTDIETRNGFHVGIYNEIFLKKHIALQTELLYSQQGYKISNNAGNFTQELNYINLPVMLKIYPHKNLYLEGGPQIGVAIYHKETIDASFDLFDSESEYNPNDYDFGWNVGTGFRTDSGLTLGIRYYFGTSKVYDQGNQKNRVLQISAGFGF